MQGLLGSRGSDRRMRGLGGTVANPGFTRGRESSLPADSEQEDGPSPRPRGWGLRPVLPLETSRAHPGTALENGSSFGASCGLQRWSQPSSAPQQTQSRGPVPERAEVQRCLPGGAQHLH